jgi:hypothetical protein
MINRIAILLICLSAAVVTVQAQEKPETPSLVGSWEGPLVIGRDSTNLAFTFSMSDGEYTAALISGGMGIYGMPADTVIINERKIIIRIPRLDVEFTGTARLDEAEENIIRIDGDWFQYSEMVPVVLLPVDQPTF